MSLIYQITEISQIFWCSYMCCSFLLYSLYNIFVLSIALALSQYVFKCL